MTESEKQALLFARTSELPCRLIKRHGKPYLERYHLKGLSELDRLVSDTMPHALLTTQQQSAIRAAAHAGSSQIYLHRFVGSGEDEGLHDHPWQAISAVLAGGYIERFSDRPGRVEERELGAGDLNVISAHHIHQIKQPKPETWTLFVTGERVKTWSFFIPAPTDAEPHAFRQVWYRDYLAARGEQTPTLTRADWWNADDCPIGETAGRAPLVNTVEGVR